MEIEEFREELQGLKFNENKWQEKMMMVTRLYKSLGYGLKDIDESVLIDKVYFYIGDLLNRIIRPNDEDFYKYVLFMDELSDVNKIKGRLTKERLKETLLSAKSTNYDINTYEGRETFLNEQYRSMGRMVLERLNMNKKFIPDLISYIANKYGVEYLIKFKTYLSQNDIKMWDGICEFALENEEARKALEKSFIDVLPKRAKTMEEWIKKGLINRIIGITTFFEKCGYLEKMCENNNDLMAEINKSFLDRYGYLSKESLESEKLMKDINVDALMVNMNENKETFCVRNLTDIKYFNQFTTEELFMLSAYYVNQFEKKVNDLNDGIHLHLKLDTFYDSVAYEEIPRKVTLDDVKVVLKQRAFLKSLSKYKFKALKDSVTDETKVEDLNLEEVPNEYIKKYKKVYEEYFDRYISKSKNDFEKDYRFIFSNRSISYCMYALKDFSLESILYMLSANKSKINFGIINEDMQTLNEYGEEQVCIGIDYKEFQTVRLHFPKDDFNEFVDTFFPERDFNDYVGNEDLKYEDRFGKVKPIKTRILYKYTKKQKQAIKKAMESAQKLVPDSYMYKYLRHMYENIHPNKNPLNNKKKPDFDEI